MTLRKILFLIFIFSFYYINFAKTECLSDKKVFSIRRYVSSLNFDSVGGGIALAQSELAHADLKPPMAMLIAEPERSPLELPEKEIGGISLGWFK